ncbi:MAG: hypothetical protein COA71_12745 [SAR86 cluster bacterium]|uniref:Transposase n=1 Tax=SAR86 cluster bacterium TaxID=2030880 RepID=A0A2A5C9A7_9GAMM|nr:MAG: hypothetical protein COA71_12745 [SAR86 cluster bacterium]
MSTQKRQSFSPDFKREAVRLLEQGDKQASQLARDLGVARNKLYRWQEEIERHGGSAFPGKGSRQNTSKTANEESVLRAENKRLREEDI